VFAIACRKAGNADEKMHQQRCEPCQALCSQGFGEGEKKWGNKMGFAQGEEEMSKVQQTDELPEILWHYTKMDVLEKIFPPKGNEEYNEGKIKLRFTNCRFLNDPSEFLVLQKLLLENEKIIIKKYDWTKEHFERYIKECENNSWDYYTFSMSCLENSFAFWSKEYAGTDGIAIGFNAEKFKEKVAELEDEIELQPAVFSKVCYVDYNESIENIDKSANLLYEGSIEKKLEEFLDLGSDKSIALTHLLGYYSCIYKFASWEHEREVRVFLRDLDKERTDSKNHHGEEIDEEENLNAKVEFMKGKITKSCCKFFDKDIVKSIMLGPDCGDKHIKAVEEYLEKNKYNNISVSKSKAFDLRYKN
jgi:hypothetical protein